MMICIPRFLGFLFLLFTSVVGFADVGYIKHKIINNTPHELYVGIRQQFSYPIDSCLGVVSPNTTKECDGMFEMGYPNFMIEIIKNTPTREELKAFANFKNYVQNQSFLVDWSVDLDEAETLKVSFIAKNY
jgi:hypothetical protein